MAEKKDKKKIKVQDLKPKKDVKGGFQATGPGHGVTAPGHGVTGPGHGVTRPGNPNT